MGMVLEAHLRELFELRNVVDELVEQGLVKRASVGEVIGEILSSVGARLGLHGAFIETYAEDLALHLFTWSPTANTPLVVPAADDTRERIVLRTSATIVVAQPLDVAGTWFGRAG